MLVGELMRISVVSVAPTLPVNAIVALLAQHGLHGAPVVDEGDMLVGMVTESDLLRRLALTDAPQQTWLQSLFSDHDRAADRYALAHGATAQDVMTSRLWTVDEDATAAHAARQLEEHRVRQLPVLRNGRLVGMVSRADLLRALLVTAPGSTTAAASDEAVRAAILDGMARQAWAKAPSLSIEVRAGVVELRGSHASAATRRALAALVAGIPGVVRVIDNAAETPPGSMSA